MYYQKKKKVDHICTLKNLVHPLMKGLTGEKLFFFKKPNVLLIYRKLILAFVVIYFVHFGKKCWYNIILFV